MHNSEVMRIHTLSLHSHPNQFPTHLPQQTNIGFQIARNMDKRPKYPRLNPNQHSCNYLYTLSFINNVFNYS